MRSSMVPHVFAAYRPSTFCAALPTVARRRGAMAERCRFEFLGSFALKGKEQPVEVFAVPSGQKVQ